MSETAREFVGGPLDGEWIVLDDRLSKWEHCMYRRSHGILVSTGRAIYEINDLGQAVHVDTTSPFDDMLPWKRKHNDAGVLLRS